MEHAEFQTMRGAVDSAISLLCKQLAHLREANLIHHYRGSVSILTFDNRTSAHKSKPAPSSARDKDETGERISGQAPSNTAPCLQSLVAIWGLVSDLEWQQATVACYSAPSDERTVCSSRRSRDLLLDLRILTRFRHLSRHHQSRRAPQDSAVLHLCSTNMLQ
jgi:hypothetical protein